ncbi:MFS transporter, DHA1 family, bicyclomycin/chloramphenicol resistance protein [Variovorax sp. YR266]|uniref:multidrug effflux MFS transporter n=1 Tax=Variovorax sp. YR266 TaxID=1884386 RepID=UPI00089D993C|nr:multidrug effflux MFS transporter [Variovorax sp. YR266]SDZ70738.1 MFS transporter, DHA1 family, bicyclomycin/chloramphenicol resistance protein [Variovorax sp. YR266]
MASHLAATEAAASPSRGSKLRLLLILGALMAFTSLSTDIYLPAMPQMQRELQGNAELTITGFLVGFALAQLVWGPVSDRIGRRRPLVIGVALFVVGSLGCALSQTMGQMVFWRMFQAFGACTGPMLARAMVRDLYPRTQAAQTLSTLTVIMAVAPIVGPLLGGQIVRFGSWHGIFWLLAAVGALMQLALRQLPESLPAARRATTPTSEAFADYRALLGNAVFMRYTLCVTLFYVGAYAFIAGSPHVYIEYFHVDAQHYGWLFGLNVVGLMAVSMVNRRLVSRYRLDALLRTATAIAALAMLAGLGLVAWHLGGLPGVVVPVFVFFSMNGVIAASATAAALDDVQPGLAGSAAALIGSLQYGSGIVSSLLLAGLSDGTPRPMVVVMALSGTACAAMAFWRRRELN